MAGNILPLQCREKSAPYAPLSSSKDSFSKTEPRDIPLRITGRGESGLPFHGRGGESLDKEGYCPKFYSLEHSSLKGKGSVVRSNTAGNLRLQSGRVTMVESDGASCSWFPDFMRISVSFDRSPTVGGHVSTSASQDSIDASPSSVLPPLLAEVKQFAPETSPPRDLESSHPPLRVPSDTSSPFALTPDPVVPDWATRAPSDTHASDHLAVPALPSSTHSSDARYKRVIRPSSLPLSSRAV